MVLSGDLVRGMYILSVIFFPSFLSFFFFTLQSWSVLGMKTEGVVVLNSGFGVSVFYALILILQSFDFGRWCWI